MFNYISSFFWAEEQPLFDQGGYASYAYPEPPKEVTLGLKLKPVTSEQEAVENIRSSHTSLLEIRQIKHKTSAGAQNFSKNRYIPDILPWDHSVFNEPYVNANCITLLGERYIATQGPAHDTIDDFVQMVWKTGGIVVNLIEENEDSSKCFPYWSEENLKSIERIDEKVVKGFTHYTFLFKGTDQTFKVIRHTTWEDGKETSPEKLMGLINAVDEQRESKLQPIIVHCSAGVGRTATLITLHAALHKMKDEPFARINFPELIRSYQAQRMQAISAKQLMSIYQVALAKRTDGIEIR